MESMRVQNSSQASYGYGLPPQGIQEKQQSHSTNKRDTYGTALLEKFDDKAYQAFLNSTAELSTADKSLAARTLERTAASSAANQYALAHDIKLTQDLSVVHNFFQNYQDVVSSDQIKHLLNTRLQDNVSVEGKSFESEQFFQNFTAQLGGTRALDLRV